MIGMGVIRAEAQRTRQALKPATTVFSAAAVGTVMLSTAGRPTVIDIPRSTGAIIQDSGWCGVSRRIAHGLCA